MSQAPTDPARPVPPVAKRDPVMLEQLGRKLRREVCDQAKAGLVPITGAVDALGDGTRQIAHVVRIAIGARNLFGGEGGFIAHLTGTGQAVVAAYGSLDEHVLPPGQSVVVDSGHLVAYDDTVGMQVRTAGGLMTSVKSGEGLIVEMSGPGRVWTQSRNPNALVAWLTEVLPFARTSGS